MNLKQEKDELDHRGSNGLNHRGEIMQTFHTFHHDENLLETARRPRNSPPLLGRSNVPGISPLRRGMAVRRQGSASPLQHITADGRRNHSEHDFPYDTQIWPPPTTRSQQSSMEQRQHNDLVLRYQHPLAKDPAAAFSWHEPPRDTPLARLEHAMQPGGGGGGGGGEKLRERCYGTGALLQMPTDAASSRRLLSKPTPLELDEALRGAGLPSLAEMFSPAGES